MDVLYQSSFLQFSLFFLKETCLQLLTLFFLKKISVRYIRELISGDHLWTALVINNIIKLWWAGDPSPL